MHGALCKENTFLNDPIIGRNTVLFRGDFLLDAGLFFRYAALPHIFSLNESKVCGLKKSFQIEDMRFGLVLRRFLLFEY